jgi:hypothetical protein
MSSASQFANPVVVEGQQQQVADAIESIQDDIGELPTPTNLPSFVQWAVDIFTAIVNVINLIAITYARRIMDIESHIRDGPPSSNVAAASTSTPSAPASRLKRCTKCHARGHDVSLCRTADASAMRKRIAANTRRNREARAIREQAPAYTGYPPSISTSLLPSTLPPPSQASYSALVADAAELRRRNAQSSRDRRRSRTTT